MPLARSGYYNVKYEWNELERTKTEELCEGDELNRNKTVVIAEAASSKPFAACFMRGIGEAGG